MKTLPNACAATGWKDELFDEVWPLVVVSDASLSQTIKRARDHFRLAGFQGNTIRSVARKSYLFEHPVSPGKANGQGVTPPPTPPAPKAPTSRWQIPLLLAGITILSSLMIFWPSSQGVTTPKDPEATAKPARRAITLLRFANLRSDADEDTAAGWVQPSLTTFPCKHFNLFGLRQVWYTLRDRLIPELKFVTPAMGPAVLPVSQLWAQGKAILLQQNMGCSCRERNLYAR